MDRIAASKRAYRNLPRWKIKFLPAKLRVINISSSPLLLAVALIGALALAGCAEEPPGDNQQDPSLTQDITPPTVVSTDPIDGTTGVPVSTTISVAFSEGMDISTTQASFIILPIEDGNYSWSSDSALLTFTPDTNLAYSTSYEVIVGTGARHRGQHPGDGLPVQLHHRNA